MKDQLRALFGQSLRDLDAGDAMRRHVRREGTILRIGGENLDLGSIRRTFVVAIGKAARPMAAALLPSLHGVSVQGLVVPPAGPDALPLPPLEVQPGGHPVPDAGSQLAAERALALLGGAGAEDLVLFLLSGGGSALCEKPLDPSVSLADLQALHRLLVGSGAPIAAMNVVRRHFSAVKGGRLAVAADGARQVTLLVSDVPPGMSSAVASGPSLSDDSTPTDVDAVLDAHALRARLPASLQALLARGLVPATPKPTHPAFARASCQIVLDQQTAVAVLQRHAGAAGYATIAVPSDDGEDAPSLADRLLAALSARKAAAGDRPATVIAGGELSVALPAAAGTGGRNQQFALHCALRIAGQRVTVLSCGTDGIDGNSPAAGAVADGTTVARATALGLDAEDHLRRCNAFPLFDALGDAVVTGPTGTNVRDLRILVHA